MTSNPFNLRQVANFRDVGQTVNEYLGKRYLREGVFFRSARLDDADENDRAVTREALGIKCVIDLRTKSEQMKQAAKHDAKVAAVVAQAGSDTAAVLPLRIEGLDYHEVKVTGRQLEKYLLRQLSWLSYLNFIFLFIFGYRMKAISIIGQEVMLPRGLLGLAIDTLEASGPEIRNTLSLYATRSSLPSVVHCTHGKDRTGLVCALVLMILDVPIEAIEYDYHLTDAALDHERSEREAEIREVGLPSDWARTAKGMIKGTKAHLDEGYGGLDGYLDHIGFTKADQQQVKDNLLY